MTVSSLVPRLPAFLLNSATKKTIDINLLHLNLNGKGKSLEKEWFNWNCIQMQRSRNGREGSPLIGVPC